LYGSWHLLPLREEARQIAIVWSAVLAALLATGFALHVTSSYSRLSLGIWALIVPVLMVGLRALLRHRIERNARRGVDIRILAFVGANRTAERIAHYFHNRLWSGLRVAGVYDDRAVKRLDLQSLSLSAASICWCATRAKARSISSSSLCRSVPSSALITSCASWPTPRPRYSSCPMPTSSSATMPTGARSRASHHQRVRHALLRHQWLAQAHRRRGGSSLILLLISPLLLAIGAAVRFTSPGPAIFKQRRYGLNGQIVEVWKFRSMTVTEDGDKVVQATRGDRRITPIGAFLRRTSLDELPQFFNVLQGHMSIVGPRPHAVSHNEQYRALIHGYMLRHKVKPGITGWAQINGWRGETDSVDKMEKRVEYDMHYIRNWSLVMDVRIIAATIFKGFRGQNAY
jgi:exopolysaccharide biosynthesis polyprenyl glycosylphosphotransferase